MKFTAGWHHNAGKIKYYILLYVKILPASRAGYMSYLGGGPRVVVSTAAFYAIVRCSVPGFGGLKETKNVSSPSTCESQYCGEPP